MCGQICGAAVNKSGTCIKVTNMRIELLAKSPDLLSSGSNINFPLISRDGTSYAELLRLLRIKISIYLFNLKTNKVHKENPNAKKMRLRDVPL